MNPYKQNRALSALLPTLILALCLISAAGLPAQGPGQEDTGQVQQGNPQDDPFADIPDLDFAHFDETEGTEATSLETDSLPDSSSGNSLWRAEAKANSRISTTGKWFREAANAAQSNRDNRLNLRPLGLLFDFELGTRLDLLRDATPFGAGRKRLSLVAEFFVRADNQVANNPPSPMLPPELAAFSFGFRQLYATFYATLGQSSQEGSELELSVGRQPYAQGVSIYFNPLNYLDDSGSFFENKTNWQLLLGLSWPDVALRLRYMPVLRFRGDADVQANILDADAENSEASIASDSWEYAFSFLKSRNRRQLLSLEASLFLGQSNWQLFGYMMEQNRYNWRDGFYLALGAGGLLPFRIGKQHFQFYGEALLGNGLDKLGALRESGLTPIPSGPNRPPRYLWEDAELDKLRFRGLIGLQWSPLANLDLRAEYRYDGSALGPEQLRRFLLALRDYNDFTAQDPRQNLFWQGMMQRRPFARPFALTQHVVLLSMIWRNIADHLDIQAAYFLSLPDTSSTFQLKASLYLWDRSLELYLENRWFLPGFSAPDYWFTGAFGSVPYLGSLELGLQIQH